MARICHVVSGSARGKCVSIPLMAIPEELAAGDVAWAELQAALDAAKETSGSNPGDPWNTRDIYAHLARWQAESVRVVNLLLAREPLPPPERLKPTRPRSMRAGRLWMPRCPLPRPETSACGLAANCVPLC